MMTETGIELRNFILHKLSSFQLINRRCAVGARYYQQSTAVENLAKSFFCRHTQYPQQIMHSQLKLHVTEFVYVVCQRITVCVTSVQPRYIWLVVISVTVPNFAGANKWNINPIKATNSRSTCTNSTLERHNIC